MIQVRAAGGLVFRDGAVLLVHRPQYFRMDADGDPVPRNEVDEVRWVPIEDAPAVLSYARDRELVAQVTSGEGS